MKRISEVLQFPVIVYCGRAPSIEFQPLQKLDFIRSGIAAERSIFEELFQTRLPVDRRLGLLFLELKSLHALEG